MTPTLRYASGQSQQIHHHADRSTGSQSPGHASSSSHNLFSSVASCDLDKAPRRCTLGAMPEHEVELAEARGQFVQSLARGLAVIRAFGDASPQMTLSDVAKSTDLSRATARRFLHTLAELGYIRVSGRYFSLTPRVLELGYSYLSGLTLPEIVMPHLEELVVKMGQSSSASVLDGQDIVYVARVPTRRIMTVAINIGTRFPAHATSMGRVHLAALDDAALDQHLLSVTMEKLTPRTLTDEPALRIELDRVRRQGFALVDEELEIGLRSIAAPVHDACGRVVLAINVSVPASVVGAAALRREYLPTLRATAAAIERDLQADPSGGTSHEPGRVR